MARQSASAAKTATLQLFLRGREARNIGVFLLDIPSDKLQWRLISDWQGYADGDDLEVLQDLNKSLRVQAELMGGTRLLAHIGDTWSNTLRLCDEQDVEVQDHLTELGKLFRERVGHGWASIFF